MPKYTVYYDINMSTTYDTDNTEGYEDVISDEMSDKEKAIAMAQFDLDEGSTDLNELDYDYGDVTDAHLKS